MTDYLKQIKTGKEAKPRKLLLYGTAGIGKTTFASQAPAPIILQTEEGANEIDVPKFPLAETFEVAMSMLTSLKGEHKFKTLVVDSVDWLEKLIWTEVCASERVQSITEIDYGKGYGIAMSYWERFKFALDTLRKEKDMHIVLISHSKVEKYNSPDVEAYDRYSPKLHKSASAMLQEWADEVFFCNYKVNAIETGEGFHKKVKGIGEGRRIVYTNERPAYLAKNRLGIKDNIDMTWTAYEAYFTTNTNKPKGEK